MTTENNSQSVIVMLQQTWQMLASGLTSKQCTGMLGMHQILQGSCVHNYTTTEDRTIVCYVQGHRRRLLQMIVGRDFSFPSLPLLPPSFPPLLPSPTIPSLLPLSSSLRCPLPPSLLSFYLFPFPFPHPLNPARDLEEHCELLSGSRQSPAAKLLWCSFRLKSAQLLSLA